MADWITPPDPEREYNLISQLELRIASASTDEKFESIIQKFLLALLLKLATSVPKNRELATKVCTYVYQRVKIGSEIQVPIAAVVKTYSEAKIAGVVQFSLLFLTLGLPRLKDEQAVEALSSVLQSVVPNQEVVDNAQLKPWALVFDFLLDVLRRWRVPERGSKEEQALKEKFALTPVQTNHLASRLGDWVLHDPKNPSNPGSVEFHSVYDKNYKRRAETIPPLGKFLFTSIFDDRQRFIPAVIMSVDANASAVSMSDVMFKQCHFDLEDDQNVTALFGLYSGGPTKVRTRILTLLSRSQRAASHPDKFMELVRQELDSGSLGHGPTPSALEKSKLHAALFSYLMWVVRVGPNLGNVSTEIQDLMKAYIDSQGWPVMNDRSSAIEFELRGKAYESIGLLGVKQDDQRDEAANERMLDLIAWLFASLGSDTTAGIKSSIEEAIGRIMNTVVDLDGSTLSRFKNLLLWNMLAQPGEAEPTFSFPLVNRTKYPAVRFANKCLPFSDVDARFIDVLALDTSDRREVAEEGLRGLDPYWHASSSRLSGGLPGDHKLTMPRFENVVKRFFEGSPEEKKLYESTTKLASAVRFCRNILVCNTLETTTTHRPEDSTDWQQSIDALVNNDKEVREKIKLHLRDVNTDALITFLKMALLGASRESGECLEVSLEVLSLAPNGTLDVVRDSALAASSSVVSKPGLQLRAARIFGIVSSADDGAATLANAELEQVQGWKAAVGEQANRCQGQLLRVCFCLTRSQLRRRMDNDNPVLQALTRLVRDIIKSTSDKSIKDTAYRSLRQVALCTPPSLGPPTSDDLLNPLIADAKKESEIAVAALGPLLGVIHARGPASEFDSVFSRVLALHEVKRAEFHFALGEALAVAGAGWRSSSTMTEFDVDAELPDWGYSGDLMINIVDKVLENSKTTKPALKKATAIWLLCLIQYCGDSSPVLSRLRECQATFTKLLNDRDEIVQETGSRGLSLVYERGDKALREDLVRDLVQSFTGSNAKMSGTVNEDTQLFEAGALPTEKGESVTTYKDIVRLATEMGDPSLVYKFMNLASSNAIWSSRAAFGRFGLGNILADSAYLAENKKFYPKLFRYRFDPNPNVQRSMNEIWRALVKDPSAVINSNFDLIMEDLLKSIVSGKEWRAREASCAAISDLVQGRDVDMFEKYLDEIWKVAFKVLDDVKETVRVAAIKLCRTLTSMLIRNLEIGDGNTKRSATMLSHAMPFLIQQMEGGAGQDVQQYAIATLLEIVKKSPPKALRPYAPQVLETFIVSLSSLEHESINYLHLNADKYGLTTEKLDKMRVSSINASPVTEAIEQCLESITMQTDTPVAGEPDGMEGAVSTSKPSTPSQSPMDDAMQRLAGAYRAAIGLPSKVGLSRVMIALVVRHPTAFRPYVDRFVQLTRKHVLDRNATISVAFSTSLGYLIRLASDKEIQATSEYARKLYFESQELVHRSVAGEIVQAISKASNDVFMKSASRFLPFAFIGRQDTDNEVKERFDIPWKENVGGPRSINLYLTEIVSLISAQIKSTLWPIKHACCFAVADMVSSMDSSEKYSESAARLIWKVVQEALDGKTWAGKEEIIKTYPKFVEQAQCIWSDKSVSQQMRKIAVREAKRTNVSYRPHAIESLGEFALVRKDLDLSQDIVPYLADILDELTDKDAMEVDETSGKTFENKTVAEANVNAIVSCLFRILASHPNADVLGQVAEIVKKAQAMKTYVVDLAVYENATVFVKKWPVNQKNDGVDVDMKGADREHGNGALASTRDRTSAGEDQQPGGPREDYERFEPLVLAVIAGENDDRQGSQPDNVRRERVALAVALAERGTRVSAPLAAILGNWAGTERSRLLCQDIERAQLLLQRTR